MNEFDMTSMSGKVVSDYEHILIKMMQLNNKSVDNFEFDQEKVDYHYSKVGK